MRIRWITRFACDGFTLIELMIVIAVIVIVAAIAIPNMMTAKMRANESSAVGTIRTISSAETAFKIGVALDADSDGIGEFTTLALLGTTAPGYLEATLAQTGSKAGYTFTAGAKADAETGFTANANPITPNSSGIRRFYVDESSVIRFNSTAAASDTDMPLN